MLCYALCKGCVAIKLNIYLFLLEQAGLYTRGKGTQEHARTSTRPHPRPPPTHPSEEDTDMRDREGCSRRFQGNFVRRCRRAEPTVASYREQSSKTQRPRSLPPGRHRFYFVPSPPPPTYSRHRAHPAARSLALPPSAIRPSTHTTHTTVHTLCTGDPRVALEMQMIPGGRPHPQLGIQASEVPYTGSRQHGGSTDSRPKPWRIGPQGKTGALIPADAATASLQRRLPTSVALVQASPVAVSLHTYLCDSRTPIAAVAAVAAVAAAAAVPAEG